MYTMAYDALRADKLSSVLGNYAVMLRRMVRDGRVDNETTTRCDIAELVWLAANTRSLGDAPTLGTVLVALAFSDVPAERVDAAPGETCLAVGHGARTKLVFGSAGHLVHIEHTLAPRI